MPTVVSSQQASISNTDGPTALTTSNQCHLRNRQRNIDTGCRDRRNGSIYLFGRRKCFYHYLVYADLAAGTYDIEVKDANGCIFATGASISNTDGPTALTTSVTNATCGTANGTLTLGAVTGGTAPYTYSVEAAYTTTLDYTDWLPEPMILRSKMPTAVSSQPLLPSAIPMARRLSQHQNKCHLRNRQRNIDTGCRDRRNGSIYLFDRRNCLYHYTGLS